MPAKARSFGAFGAPIVLHVAGRAFGLDVEFGLLGPLEAWAGDQRLHLGGPRHERALAVLLLDANRVVSLARLIEAVWGDDPPRTAAHQIRKMVLDLRHRVPGGGESIVTDGPGYRLLVDDDGLDVRQFDRYLARAREAEASGSTPHAIVELRAALALWRGPALAALDGPLIAPAAAVLDERRLAVTEHLMELRLAAGDARELVAELQPLLAEHPLRETLRGQLMLALCRSGQQAEALHIYDEGRRLLSDELGIDPSRELVRRYEQILHNDPTLDSPPSAAPIDTQRPSTLPYDVSDFTGRAAELARLRAAVESASPRGLTIITIDGMAGIGKTTLAVHAAHRLAEDFPDGQLFIDLHGFTPGHDPVDPGAALDTLLRAIGVPGGQIPDDLASRSALWRVRAAGRRFLLLLDNAVDTAQIRPLLPGAPGCLVLITSRSRLASLDGAIPLFLSLPSRDDGQDMIGRVLGAERAGAEPEALDQLVDACGRLPLAMRIAAARLSNRPEWTVRHLVDRLRNAERGLAELAIDDRSVAATIRLSYNGLRPDHRRLFRLLGLHPGADFDAYAAAALAGTPVDQAERMMEDLLDARLLMQRRVGRYTFHDLLRSYAHSVVDAEECETDIRQASHRLIDYYLYVADEAGGLIQPGAQRIDLDLDHPPADAVPLADATEAFEWLDTERTNLLAVIRSGTGTGLDLHACHLAHSISRYLHLRGHVHDQAELLRSAVDSARRLDDAAAELYSLINLFIPLWHFGRFREARDCAEQALDIARRIGDRRREGISLSHMGTLLSALGRYDVALRYHRDALAIHRELGNRLHESATLVSLSVTQGILGDDPQSLASAQAALAIAREVGGEGRNVFALINVAAAYANLGNPEAASVALAEALVLARRMEMPTGEAMVLARYADVHRRLGRYEAAQDAGTRARLIFSAVQRPANLAALENILGTVHRELGEHALAMERHQRAIELAGPLELRLEVARGLNGLAHAFSALGNDGAACERWQQALAHFTDMGVPEAEPIRERLQLIAQTG